LVKRVINKNPLEPGQDKEKMKFSNPILGGGRIVGKKILTQL